MKREQKQCKKTVLQYFIQKLSLFYNFIDVHPLT